MKLCARRAVARGAACALSLLLAGPSLAEQPAAHCDPAAITLLTDSGAVAFAVEIADDPAEQARGLMFRPSLAADAGMLFVYPEPQTARFWMKNTMIPLDMLFIDDRGQVLNIAEMTTPYSLEGWSSEGAVRAVLEINGGLSAKLGLGPGTQAVHPAFERAPAPHLCPGD